MKWVEREVKEEVKNVRGRSGEERKRNPAMQWLGFGD